MFTHLRSLPQLSIFIVILLIAITGIQVFSEPNVSSQAINLQNIIQSQNHITNGLSGYNGNLNSHYNFGSSIASIGDLDNDGVSDIAVGSPKKTIFDATGTSERGIVEIIFLKNDGSVKASNQFQIVEYESNGFFGSSITGLGDIDGDSVEDIAVGTPFGDTGETTGIVKLVFLNQNGSVKSSQFLFPKQTPPNNNDIDLAYHGEYGTSLANLGDVNNDNKVDIAVGSQTYNANYQQSQNDIFYGGVYIISADTENYEPTKVITSNTNGFNITLNQDDFFGSSVAGIGDFDGDGIEDLAVGASGDDQFGINKGAVYILTLNQDKTVKNTFKLNNNIDGLENNDGFGSSLTNLGDIDGDGVTDIAVGAPKSDAENGEFYIILLNSDATIKQSQEVNSNSIGIQTQTSFGTSLASIPDLNGDCVNDLAIGNPFNNINTLVDNGSIYSMLLNSQKTEVKVRFENLQNTVTEGEVNRTINLKVVGDNLIGKSEQQLTLQVSSDTTNGNQDYTTTLQVTIPEDDYTTEKTITVPITLIDDAIIETPEQLIFTIGNTSANINNCNPSSTTLSILDNDSVPQLVISPDRIVVDENGDPGEFSLTLDSQPRENVEVTIDLGDGFDVNSRSFVFTPENWDTPQLLIISARLDNNNTNDNLQLGFSYSIGGQNYTTSNDILVLDDEVNTTNRMLIRTGGK
jgi:FG-GAP repeat/Calx-beta domain